MSASWYDVLGVGRDATTDEIRAAWKESIGSLEPTDRRFKVYNEAAGVLLDDEQRAAYDETLAPEEPEEPAEPEGLDESEAVTAVPAAQDETTEDETAEDDRDDRSEADEPEATREASGSRLDVNVPNWLLVVLLVATLAAAAGAAVLQRGNDDPDVESNVAAARTAAEAAVPKVLTYDYRYPDRDHDAAMRLLTGDFRDEYDTLWNDAILPNLEKTKATAVSESLGSGVVRASDNGERVEIVVVLSSRTTNRNVSTELPPLPLTVQMVEKNGEWLVADLDLWEPQKVTDESDSKTPGSTTPTP
ncbi:J domain-containing protein [Nocardioides sp. Root140]|uniref:J domain-containing protein n=1 Tax=Nocardioides sp. Root140 TaxID=1736460 RepID=UPI0006F774AF|nr:DnaJ domain-containing protein [Nocardioides sp. Root140]KQY56833.1 hypothetical protein ASD30_11065 [Nocardioides sp. Root140]